MVDYLLDTNIVLYFLFGEDEVVRLLNRLSSEQRTFAISTITEMELFAYRHITAADGTRIRDFIAGLYRVPVHSSIAQQAGMLRKHYRVPPIDALIAATALETSSSLITRNVRDFRQIKELKLVAI